MHERNAKVRRRIAAGKFRLRIRDLRNLGPRAEVLLAAIGITSVEALRARGSVVPVLMISGNDAENEAWASARRGDARFLQKPFSARELLGALLETLTPT